MLLMDGQNQLASNMAIAHETSSRDVFDFFGLARELRDMIFDEVAADERIVETPISTNQTKDSCTCGFCDSSLRLYTRHVPATNLLLVSQQFKAEYESRVAKAATLVVRDYVLADFPEDFTPCFRGINLTMPNLHLDLTLQCYHDPTSQNECEVVDEIAMHRSWIDQLLPKLANLRSVTADVQLQTQSPNFTCGPIVARNCADFTSMPNLKGLEVYRTDCGCGFDAWDYTAHGTHAMTWNPKSRELEIIAPSHQGDVALQSSQQQQQQSGWPKMDLDLELELSLQKDLFYDMCGPQSSLAVVTAG